MIYKGFYLESVILLIFFVRIDADWGSPNDGQYHIQTDEGDERFFRYLTDSGQFRNEKRLKDGTVVGTEAWIDALGYMRLKKYIADKDGYRILKSQTVFVGKSPIKDVITNGRINSKFNNPSTTSASPIPNAIDDSGYSYGRKKVPEILVHYNAEPIDGRYADRGYIPPSSTIAPPVTTYRPISVFTSPSTTYTPPISSTSRPYISSTTLTPPTSTPRIEFHSTAISTPSKFFLPPVDTSPIVAIRPVNVPTQLPVTVAPYTVDQLNNELDPISIKLPLALAPTIATNELPDSRTQYYGPHISSTVTPIAGVIATDRPSNTNLNVQPLFDRSSFYRNRPSYYEPNQLDANSKHFDRYNAQLANGFGYFLPRQYHEERYGDPQNRDGSFGYIDPFGIRRVVYYRTSPESGFKIRKNNRYVGFNAPPYDTK